MNPTTLSCNLVYLGNLCFPKLFDWFGSIGTGLSFKHGERSPTYTLKVLRKELNFLPLSRIVRTNHLEFKSRLVGRNPGPVRWSSTLMVLCLEIWKRLGEAVCCVIAMETRWLVSWENLGVRPAFWQNFRPSKMASQ